MSENKCQLCNLRQGYTDFTENLGTTSKSQKPDEWHKPSYKLRTHKFQAPTYKM